MRRVSLRSVVVVRLVVKLADRRKTISCACEALKQTLAEAVAEASSL